MKITALKWVPEFIQGYVCDLRIRWACLEAGLPYEVKLVGPERHTSEEYLRQQPFGQVPVLEDGEVTLFETGSMILHVGEKSEILLPLDPAARARAVTWVFAALTSVEIAVKYYNQVADSEEQWAVLRKPAARELLMKRLASLSRWLKDKEYLEGNFTAGDIMMATVLRDLNTSGLLEEFPNVLKYHQRCEARPAFQKALAEQLKNFADNKPS